MRIVFSLLLVCVFFISCFAKPSHPASLELYIDKQLQRTISIDELKAQFPSRAITIPEPHEKMTEVRYQGFPAAALLASLFPPVAQEAQIFAFTCSDGYRVVVPAEDLHTDDAYLVFARGDQREFTLRNFLADPAQGKSQNLAPLYLVWHKTKNREAKDSSTARWAFQIAKISLVKTPLQGEIPLPPKAAAQELLRGYEVFRSKCMSCHQATANAMVPSLQQVAAKAQHLGKTWLAGWLQDPQQVKPEATMPAVQINPAELSDMVAYFHFSGSMATP